MTKNSKLRSYNSINNIEKREVLYLEVYLDIIFIINFIMDYILLTIVKMILKSETSILRRVLGATIGAVGICVLIVVSLSSNFVQFIISYFFLSILIVFATYRPKSLQTALKGVILLYLATFLLGGLFNSLYYHSMFGYYMHELINGRLFDELSTSIITILGALSIIVGTVLVKTISKIYRREVSLFDTDLIFQDKTISLTGLLDTGNNLFDPIYGKPVIIIEYSSLKGLLSYEQEKYIESLIANDKHNLKIDSKDIDNIFIHMIPFQSIGKKKGLLPAITINKLVIKKDDEKISNKKVLTAIWNGQLSRENKYQLILHRDLI